MIKTEAQLRPALETELGLQLDDDIWDALKAEGYIGACFDPELKPKERQTQFYRLVDAARLALRLHKPKLSQTVHEEFSPTALITLQVNEAKQHPALLHLWETVFQGRLLSPQQKDEYNRLKLFSIFGLPQGAELPPLAETLTPQVLGTIQSLADEFSQKYGWTTESATDFILFGRQPVISKITGSVRLNRKYPLLTKIIIEANVSARPSEVAKAFAVLQKSVRASKFRRPSPKHQKLAEFAATRQHLSGKQAMAEWNALYPDWAYKRVTNFQRDRTKALRRLKP